MKHRCRDAAGGVVVVARVEGWLAGDGGGLQGRGRVHGGRVARADQRGSIRARELYKGKSNSLSAPSYPEKCARHGTLSHARSWKPVEHPRMTIEFTIGDDKLQNAK